MSNKTEQAMNSLMNGMMQYVRNEINNIPYVKTDIGIVKSVTLTDGKYIHTVTVRNFDYTGIKSLGNNEFTVDSVVYILVPNGQYSNMFILGHLDDTNANIKGGSINLGNGNFTVDNDGSMTAKVGYIGNGSNGFTISSSAIYNGTTSMADTTNNGIYLGTDGINLGKGNFKVTNGGSMTAKDGYIGNGSSGFTIGNSAIYNGMTSLGDTTHNGIYLGTDGIALGKGNFKVNNSGDGKIGVWGFSNSGLTYSNTQGASCSITPSGSGGLGGIAINSQSINIGASRTVSVSGDMGATISSTTGAISLNATANEPIECTSSNYLVKSSSKFAVQNIAGTDNFYVNQSSAWCRWTIGTSDKKLKKNIKKLDSKKACDFILNLNPCEYKFKEGDNFKHHGFIAQEVEEHISDDWGLVPESEITIKGKEETIKGIAYTEIIADLVATVQLQQEQINNLKKDIEILKKGE